MHWKVLRPDSVFVCVGASVVLALPDGSVIGRMSFFYFSGAIFGKRIPGHSEAVYQMGGMPDK